MAKLPPSAESVTDLTAPTPPTTVGGHTRDPGAHPLDVWVPSAENGDRMWVGLPEPKPLTGVGPFANLRGGR